MIIVLDNNWLTSAVQAWCLSHCLTLLIVDSTKLLRRPQASWFFRLLHFLFPLFSVFALNQIPEVELLHVALHLNILFPV